MKLLNKIISIIVIITFLFTSTFQGLSFAEEPPAETSSTGQTSQTDSTGSTSQTDSGDSTSGQEPHQPPQTDVIISGAQPYVSLEKFQVEPSTGTASLNIPIEVAPGRKGIQPSISLMYNSSSPNGILGVGWSLELGSIQRSTKRGVPKYDASDTFVLAQQGSTQELVYDVYEGYYRAKIEGAFMKIQNNGSSGWLVTDKKGIKYRFGYDSGSRQYSGANVFKWCLDKVEDLHGNYMTITYYPNDDGTNQIYPQYIRYLYTSSNPLDYHAEIKFERETETRSDIIQNYIPGFLVTTDKRIKNIYIKVDGQIQRRYELSYDSSPAQLSLLSSIQQFGQDDVSVLPATTFTYQAQASSFDATSNFSNVQAAYSYGNGGATNWKQISRYAVLDDVILQTYISCLDINGDALPDRVSFDYNGQADHWDVQLNNNDSGFEEITPWDNVQPPPNQGDPNSWKALRRTQVEMPSEEVRTFIDTFDINADGLPDRVSYNNGNSWFVQLNTGLGFDATFSWPNVQSSLTVNPVGGKNIRYSTPSGQTFIDIFDINADGLPDRVTYNTPDGNPTCNWYVQLSTGSSFANPIQWSNVEAIIPVNPVGSKYIRYTGTDGITIIDIFDINGDGLADRIGHNPGWNYWNVQLNNGTGFENSVSWNIAPLFESNPNGTKTIRHRPSSLPNQGNTYVDIFDINADGLPDRVAYDAENPGHWRVQLNNGSGFEPTINWTGVQPAHTPSATWENIRHDDISSYSDVKTYIENFDINGDGVPDRISYNYIDNSGYWDVQLNQALKPLLETINNGIGGLAQITYTPSTQYDNTGVDDPSTSNIDEGVICDLPFPIQVVSSVTVTDQASNQSYTTTYDYKDGLWDWQDREFRGFGEVKVIDIDGNYTKTSFEQTDDYKKGRILEQETWGIVSGAEHLYAKTENTWQTSPDLGAGSKFVYLLEVNNYSYEVGGAGKRTKAEYFYEENLWPETNYTQYGDLTKSIDYGEFTFDQFDPFVPGEDFDTTDNRVSEVEYVYSDDIWLLGLPKTTYVYNEEDAFGNPVEIFKQSWFYYDTPNYGATPTLGNLIKQGAWLKTDTNLTPLPGSSQNPTSTFTYDSYGNLLTTTDAIGNTTPDPDDRTTTIEYESEYHLFPVKTTNALNHTVKNIYYGVNDNQTSGEFIDPYPNQGSGLWAQTKVTLDPNHTSTNNTSVLSIYDTFGRIEKTISPFDSIEYPTSSIEYFLEQTPIKIKTHQREVSGEDGTLDSISFYDGLGRLIQTKTESENANTFIVSGQTEYNPRGLPEKKYLPKFTTNPLNTTDPIVQADPHATITYDAMGRAVQTTNPDGTHSNIIYADWSSTTIDENGHKQESDFDAFGRLITKREYTSDPVNAYATTLYNYDILGNLNSTTDTLGNSTTITYDTLGRKTSMTDPDMGYWTYQYDLVGNLISQTDAKEQTINFQYDALNRLTGKTGSTGPTNYTYDSYPINPNIKQALDNLTDNSTGRLTQATYVAGGSTTFYYDDLGREIQAEKKIDNTIYTVERSYDALGRLTQVTYPDSDTVNYSYNSAGQIEQVKDISETDPNTKLLLHCDGPTTFTDSSASNHSVTAHSNAQIDTAQSQFGVASGLFNDATDDYLSIPDSEDWNFGTGDFTVEAWSYVSSGGTGNHFIIGHGNDAGSYWVMYVAGAKLNWFHSENGGTNIVLWDPSLAGPLVTEDTWHHLAVARSNGTLYGFVDGVLTGTASDTQDYSVFTGTLKIGVDDLGNASWHNGWIDEVRVSKGIARWTTNFTPPQAPYDSGIEYYVTNVDYSASGQITKIEYGNGTTTQYTYDPLTLRLTQLQTTNNQLQNIQYLTYEYDSAGNIARISDTVNNITQEFSYDALNRLITANGIGSYGLKNYEYDQIGNMTQKGDLFLQYDQTGNAGPHAVTSTSGSDNLVFEYDLNGNMASMTNNQLQTTNYYIYDFENRLTQVKKNNQTIANFFYDGDGGRTKKTVYQNLPPQKLTLESDKSEKRYVKANVHDSNVNSYESILRLRSGLTLSGIEGSNIRDYWRWICDNSRSTFDELFGVKEAEASELVMPTGPTPVTTIYVGSLYEKTNGSPTKHIFLGSMRVVSKSVDSSQYYHTNHLGSTDVITNDAGEQIAHYEYRPYGSIASQTGQDVTDYKFTGKPLDDETGLYFYGVRYYNPVIGRFITPDAIVQAPYDPQSLNRYSYCRNNPVNLVDQTGNFWFIPLIIAAVKAAAVFAVTYMLPGAILGSLIGGGLAAITGGNIGQGFAMGAISGAIMGGIGGFGFEGGLAILANGLGGAASGAINASIFGGDVGRWAMIGGLSGLAFSSISQLGVRADGSSTWQWDLGRVGLSAAAGGGISEIAGGSFGQGAAFAGAFAGASFIYKSVAKYPARNETAKTWGKPRKEGEKVPYEQSTVGVVDSGGEKTFLGKIANFFAGETGPVMNFVAKYIRMANPLSKFHDPLANGIGNLFGGGPTGAMAFLSLTVPTIAPSYAITVAGAVINEQPGLMGEYLIYGDDSDRDR